MVRYLPTVYMGGFVVLLSSLFQCWSLPLWGPGLPYFGLCLRQALACWGVKCLKI